MQQGPHPQPASAAPPSAVQIQKVLDENCILIQTIQELQDCGKVGECMSYQQTLHRNLVYLANLADQTQNIQQLLPVNKTKKT